MPIKYFNATVVSTLVNIPSQSELLNLNSFPANNDTFESLATLKSFVNSVNLTNVILLVLKLCYTACVGLCPFYIIVFVFRVFSCSILYAYVCIGNINVI